ncbi:MAG: transposase [Acidobacteriia bacterium]|nr:transposase [Terriglobia bacterium]
MNTQLQPDRGVQRPEPAVRISAPAGFFERLGGACDFHAITKNAFNRYNPRPSSSKADPSLFFKILLMEYIFDVSSEAMRQEFSSNAGLRAFLGINEVSPLPASDEVVMFRVKLGWMGFKKLLDALLREVKKHGLPEVDVSILEKRYDKPLLAPLGEQPYAMPTAPSRGPSAVQRTGPAPHLVTPEIRKSKPLVARPTEPDISKRPPQTERAVKRTSSGEVLAPTVERPVYAQRSLEETAQLLWQGREKARSNVPSSSSAKPVSALSGTESAQMGAVATVNTPQPATAIGSADQVTEIQERGLKKSFTSGLESDPLGIEVYFDSMGWAPLESMAAIHEASTVPTSAQEISETTTPSNSKLDVPPMPAEVQPEPMMASDKAFSAGEAEYSPEYTPGQSYSEPEVDYTAEGPAPAANRMVDADPGAYAPPQGDFDYAQEESGLSEGYDQDYDSTPSAVGDREPAFPAFAAYSQQPARKRFFSLELFTKALYIFVPILIAFGVYVLITFVRHNQPTPLAAEAANPHPTVSQQAQTPGTPITLPSQSSDSKPANVTGPATSTSDPTSTPAQPKAEETKPLRQNVSAASADETEEAAGDNAPPDAKPEAPVRNKPRTQVSSAEGAKKAALILHLRQVYHLDLQADQYSYEELKDINNRLERESKKPPVN